MRQALPALFLCLLVLGCQPKPAPPGPGPDLSKEALDVLRFSDFRASGLQTLVRVDDQVYMPEVYTAWVRFPNTATSQPILFNLFEKPLQAIAQHELPELLAILGAMHEADYPELPIDPFGQVFLMRAFGKDARMYPNPSLEAPLGVDLDQLLASGHAAMAPAEWEQMQARIDRVFGNNPKAFSTRDPGWLRHLIEGETGDLEGSPEVIFERLCLAVAVNDYQRVLPALEAVATSTKAINEHRFAAAMAVLLLTPDQVGADHFRTTLFDDAYLPRHYSFQGYRLLSTRKDPTLRAAIDHALTALPQEQKIDYAEFLARYGDPKDLPILQSLMDTPISNADLTVSTERSYELVNPNNLDMTRAIQDAAILALRDPANDKPRDPIEDTPEVPGKPFAKIDNTGGPADPQGKNGLAEQFHLHPEQLLALPLTPEEVRARRLWWLRFYPIDAVHELLGERLTRGSTLEKIVALRILGMNGGEAQLGLLGQHLKRGDVRLKAEAAGAYLRVYYRVHGYPDEGAPPTPTT